MSGQSLDYTIQYKNKYDVIEGKIDSITQKNTEGCTIRANQQKCKLSLELKLRSRSIVKTFEVKTLSINKFTFELFGENDECHQTIEYCFSKQSQTHLIEVKQSYHRRKESSKIKIEVECLDNDNGIFRLGYLFVRGEKCREEPKNKSISKRIAQGDQFFDAKASKHYRPGMPKTDIFSQRKKNKETVSQKIQQSQESQLRKAIQLSKKEAQASRKKQNQMRQPKKQLPIIEQRSNIYISKPREYTRIDYDKYKDIFKYVSAAWVQAQRAAENERGIPQNQKLSKVLAVRIFHNKIMCVDVPDKQKKRILQNYCEELGAKLRKQPEDYCMLLTDRLDTQKVAKARKMKGVKILKSKFVSDCRQVKAYLDEKDYFFK